MTQPGEGHPFCLIVIRFAIAGEQEPWTEQAVTVIRRALRPADLLFSSAADELVALLLNTDSRTSIAIAARVAAGLNNLVADELIGSVKLGIACGPGEGRNGDDLLGLARERAARSVGQLGTNGAVH